MTKKILYLEDDEVLAKVTSNGLEKKGYEVDHFRSLDQVNKLSSLQEFDLALLDLKLEEGVSLPLIEKLKNDNPDIKILVLTGYASIATAVSAVKIGATNYLSKPATIDEIIKAFEIDSADPKLTEVKEQSTMSFKLMEWEHLQSALEANNGNVSATARQLKMHRRTLQRKLQKKPQVE